MNELLENNFPGKDLIIDGLKDLAANIETVPALLVSVGSPRLIRIGFEIENTFIDPEMKLYEKLSELYPNNAHSKYNALIRQLVSFERACECAK